MAISTPEGIDTLPARVGVVRWPALWLGLLVLVFLCLLALVVAPAEVRASPELEAPGVVAWGENEVSSVTASARTATCRLSFLD